MKRLSSLPYILIIVLLINACSARISQADTTPTINPVDLQSTMAAAALRIAAETQAAIPTSTPLPPTPTFTNTPDVTATIPGLPTLGATFTPSPVGSGAQDPCITATLPPSLPGDRIRMRIDNPTRATINVTVYLLQASPGAVCGYRAYTVDPAGSLVINDLPVGCYTLWAWNPDPDDYFMVTNGSSCLDTSNSWAFDVSTNRINLRP